MQLKPARFKNSIAQKTLLKMGARIAVVIIITTAIGYFHMVTNLKEQALGHLEKYVLERGQREEAVFTLAENNHSIFKNEILKSLKELGPLDPLETFDRLFVRHKDGITRNRSEIFDGTRQAGVYIDKRLEINADIRRRVLTFYNLCNSYGPAWHNRFQDTYITTPENIMVIYWPEIPGWCQDATADLYMPDEEYVWVAGKKHNPQRQTVWTGLFYDYVAKVWMVSCETPVDMDARHIGTIGHDITLNELVDRTVKDHLKGAYNIIFRNDGRLIVHPDRMKEIQHKEGYFDIEESGDQHLKDILHIVRKAQAGEVVVDNKRHEEYLAITRIKGPGWYFLTVFPESIIEDRAFGTARVILLLGLISLLIEVCILFFILRNQISLPLKEFMHATDNIASGDLDIQLDEKRTDELGRLAKSFSHMRSSIRNKINELENHKEQLEDIVKDRTRKLKESQKEALDNAHKAGMADIATGTLHNVGNILNSVKTSAQIIAEVHESSAVRDFKKANSLLRENIDRIEEFILQNPKGIKLMQYYLKLEDEFSAGKIQIMEHVDRLTNKVNAIEEVIAAQQSYAGISALTEESDLSDIVEDALAMQSEPTKRDNIKVAKDFSNVPTVTIQRTKLVHVLINLIKNARESIVEARENERDLAISINATKDSILLKLRDNGVGIARDNIDKIFSHGFTTKQGGHGFGLHSSANYMKEMGGNMWAESEGEGKGASFFLRFPHPDVG